MQVIGIILEANPLHNGHAYLFNQVKIKYPNSIIIAITSTSFTMRGEISLINKYDKTSYLLNIGANIVIELPITRTLASADFFCKNAVSALNQFKVDTIVCGSEVDNIFFFEHIYKIINSSEFIKDYEAFKCHHYSKKQEYNKLLSNYLSEEQLSLFNKPNNTLAFLYYKTIKDNNLNISLDLIKRTNDYYENKSSSLIASGTTIRLSLEQNLNVSSYLPFVENLININDSYERLFLLCKYALLNTNVSTNIIYDDKEGLYNYLKTKISSKSFKDFNDFLDFSSSKKLTKNTIKRLLLKLLLSMPINNIDINVNNIEHQYLRILGFDNKGISYVNSLDKNTKYLIFSSINEVKDKIRINNDNKISIFKSILEELKYEELSVNLYYILTNSLINKKNNEYSLPIRKKE